ncbi:MAG: glycosyltransferase [Promethearchaeota archaeon]
MHIGTLPPPLGGISVYLHRLSQRFPEDIFIDYNKLGFFRFNYWILQQLFSKEKKEFIIHSNNTRIRMIFFLLCLISKHDYSLVIHAITIFDDYNKSNPFYKFLIKKMLNKASNIQVVNHFMLKQLKIMDLKNPNVIIKPAFLPPLENNEKDILISYDKQFLEFLKARKPLLISNAHALEFYKDHDLYGLNTCIELTYQLKKEFPNLGFIFALANDKINETYLQKMKKRIRRLNIEKNFFMLTGQKIIWPLFKKVDLMIRPTITDGDSVSIREALYFKLPVIASDVVSRPKPCITYNYDDFEDLFQKCIFILKKSNI